MQDEKGRDRERYPIVYGARLKVKDGQKVAPGQVLVEWDPYTFSIVTDDPGSVRFKDILEGVTVHEEVDEVIGLSRFIVVDSPDEKKQPQTRPPTLWTGACATPVAATRRDRNTYVNLIGLASIRWVTRTVRLFDGLREAGDSGDRNRHSRDVRRTRRPARDERRAGRAQDVLDIERLRQVRRGPDDA